MDADRPQSVSFWYEIPWLERIAQTVNRVEGLDVQSFEEIPFHTQIPRKELAKTIYAFDEISLDDAETLVKEFIDYRGIDDESDQIMIGDEIIIIF